MRFSNSTERCIACNWTKIRTTFFWRGTRIITASVTFSGSQKFRFQSKVLSAGKTTRKLLQKLSPLVFVGEWPPSVAHPLKRIGKTWESHHDYWGIDLGASTSAGKGSWMLNGDFTLWGSGSRLDIWFANCHSRTECAKNLTVLWLYATVTH
jgi:hypothetical protein